MLIALEWGAFILGTIGTVCWAKGATYKNKPIEGWFWLFSGLLWIIFALSQKHFGLALRDVLGVILYIFGIIRSFRENTGASAAIATISPTVNTTSSTIVTRQGH